WLTAFFHIRGGKDFDVLGIHLYPSDDSAKGGDGPEWSMAFLDQQIRPVLAANGITKPLWDTETNVGRRYAGIFFTGMAAAGLTTRTFVLNLSDGLRRVFWYAADDRTVTGIALEQADYRSLSEAGLAEQTAYRVLVGSHVGG